MAERGATEQLHSGAAEPAHAHQSVLLSGPGAVFLGLTLAVAAWFGQTLLVFICGSVLAVIGVSRGWSRLAVTRLSYDRTLSSTRAFPDDGVGVRVSLDNRKLLPLTWVESSDDVPDAVAPEPGSSDPALGIATALLWYQRAVRERRLECRRRGYFPIGPARVTTGDIFGLFPRTEEVLPMEPLIVYPRIHPVGAFGLPSQHPLGESRALSRLFEDPTRPVGLREYTPDVPFRHIHWKASARHQELQIKVFEPSATVQTAIFLDVDGFAPAEGTGENPLFESAASVAASLAHHLSEQHQAVGLFANSAQADGSGPPALMPASGADQLKNILEALAKIGPAPAGSFTGFLDLHGARLPFGSTLCLIAPSLTAQVAIRLRAMGGAGFHPVVVLVGSSASDDFGLPCRRVGAAGDLRGLP